MSFAVRGRPRVQYTWTGLNFGSNESTVKVMIHHVEMNTFRMNSSLRRCRMKVVARLNSLVYIHCITCYNVSAAVGRTVASTSDGEHCVGNSRVLTNGSLCRATVCSATNTLAINGADVVRLNRFQRLGEPCSLHIGVRQLRCKSYNETRLHIFLL